MSTNPYTSPEENPYATPASYQTAEVQRKKAIWTKELKSARTVLIVVGVIQLLFGAFLLSQIRKSYDDAVKAEVAKQGPGFVVDKELADANFEEQKTFLYAMHSIPIAFAVFLFVMAALVFKFPVGVTLASLITFVVVHAADAIADPTALAKGIILKVIFIMVLWKAYKSARAAKAAME
jgi:hypothetical protein